MILISIWRGFGYSLTNFWSFFQELAISNTLPWNQHFSHRQMAGWKMKVPFGGGLFRGYVSFRGKENQSFSHGKDDPTLSDWNQVFRLSPTWNELFYDHPLVISTCAVDTKKNQPSEQSRVISKKTYLFCRLFGGTWVPSQSPPFWGHFQPAVNGQLWKFALNWWQMFPPKKLPKSQGSIKNWIWPHPTEPLRP